MPEIAGLSTPTPKGTLQIGLLSSILGTKVIGSPDVNSVVLEGTAAVLHVSKGGFSYQSGDDLIWTNIDLVGQDTSANIRTQIYRLDRIKEFAQNYHADPTLGDPVFLGWSSYGEAYRSSLVYDLQYEVKTEEILNAMLGYGAAKVHLSIQHAPWWESATSEASAGTVNTLGGMATIVITGSASYPGRIGTLQVEGYNDEFVLSLQKGWIGIREERNGYSHFDPVWECEKGSIYTDASRGTSAAASNGTTVNVTFATDATMAKRVETSIFNVAGSIASYEDFCGRYMILNRMKLSGTAVEIAVELKYGWLGMSGLESSAGVTYVSAISNPGMTQYNLIPLGVVDVPSTGDRDFTASHPSHDYLKYYGLSLYAERLSGSGSAAFDCFVLIPTDHLFTFGSAAINDFTAKRLLSFTGIDDIAYAMDYGLGIGVGNVEYSFDNWSMPMDNCIMVAALQNGTIHQLNGSCVISIDYLRRFRSYRES